MLNSLRKFYKGILFLYSKQAVLFIFIKTYTCKVVYLWVS